MAQVKLMVLYPQPTDTEQFDKDYAEHLSMFHQKMNIPQDVRPYTVTKFVTTPMGKAAYYQVFTFPFPSAEALQQAMSSAEMLMIAADAARISTGGAPVVLVGNDIP